MEKQRFNPCLSLCQPRFHLSCSAIMCHVNTMDQLPNLEYKPAIQRSDCGFERRKTFAVEMNALARSSDIQRSFLSVSCEHFGSTIKFEVRNLNPWLAIVILNESAVKRGRDDFFSHSTMQARKLNSSGDAAVTTAVYLCSSLFCYIGCISVHLLSYYNHVQNQKQTSGENNPLDQYILVLAQTGRQ